MICLPLLAAVVFFKPFNTPTDLWFLGSLDRYSINNFGLICYIVWLIRYGRTKPHETCLSDNAWCLQHNNRYGRLFVQALNRYGILCLGLYRVMELSEDSRRSSRRYVMTHPPPSVNLLPSDKVTNCVTSLR